MVVQRKKKKAHKPDRILYHFLLLLLLLLLYCFNWFYLFMVFQREYFNVECSCVVYAVQKFATLNGNVEWTNSILKYRDIHRPFACSISLITKKHERHDERENEIELERRIYAVCKWRRRSRRKTIDNETIKRVDTLYSWLSAILAPSRPLSTFLSLSVCMIHFLDYYIVGNAHNFLIVLSFLICKR